MLRFYNDGPTKISWQLGRIPPVSINSAAEPFPAALPRMPACDVLARCGRRRRCSARRRHFVGGGGQRSSQQPGLSGSQVVSGVQAGDADPLRGAVLADNFGHDDVAVRPRPLDEPTKTFNQGAHGVSIGQKRVATQ